MLKGKVAVVTGGSQGIGKEICRKFAENGADMVVNNHQHCPMAYELWNGVPIFYSMGNLVFAPTSNNGMWNYGYMISAEWINRKIKFEIIPYFYGDGKVNRFTDEKKEYFMEYMDMLAKYSFDEKISNEFWLAWCYKNGPFLDKVAKQNINFKKNSYNCEAHCELLGTYYEEYVENGRMPNQKYLNYIKEIMNYKIVEIKE